MKLALYALPALLLVATPCFAQATASDDANSPRGGTMDENPNPTPNNSAPNMQGSTMGLSNQSGALNNGTAASPDTDTTASNTSTESSGPATASNSAPSDQVAMNTPSQRSKSRMSEKQLNAEEAQETQQLNQNEAQYAQAGSQ